MLIEIKGIYSYYPSKKVLIEHNCMAMKLNGQYLL